MIRGYAGKLLEINLSTGHREDVSVRDEDLRDYVGGRGLAARILWDRLGPKWSAVDPLGTENILLFLTGPLTGFYPGGRICVSAKSPQSGGMVGSTVGGEFGVELKCAGYDGIIVSGEAERPVYLFVKDSDVEIKDAAHVWGKDSKQTFKTITRECRESLKKRFPRQGEWKEPSLLYIGPAGENKVRTACVAAKWTHAAGYGGYGAVMGAKKLKAIAVTGTGPLPEVADLGKVKRLIQRVCKDVYENDLWRRWGTGSSGYEVGAKTSSEPIRNWQEEWHAEKAYGVDQFEGRVWVKPSWSDFGCPTCCLKVSMVKTGRFKGAITDNPDYELQAYLGPNLGIFTPEENVFLTSLIDDLGLCGIQTGNVMGFAAELFQRGILTKTDLDGIELKWGDAEAFAQLARKIALRQGMGNLLAEGTYHAALKIGEIKKVDVMTFAVQAKGISIGAHGIRSGKDYPSSIAYVCSVQGGDHTSAAGLPLCGSGSEVWEIFNDSGVHCMFNSFGVPRNTPFKMYEAITGLPLTRQEWCKPKALRIIQIQRSMLLLGNPNAKRNVGKGDENPPRFYEPLPSGPFEKKAADRSDVGRHRRRYYEELGWDENGIPKTEILEELGLDDVDLALKELRQTSGS